MKKWIVAALVCMMLMTGALAAEGQYPNSAQFGMPEGPVGSKMLMVDLPEETVMTEFVSFEDGDYIQTFQLPGGAVVQMLRYAEFGMTLEELAEGEWTGYVALDEIAAENMNAGIARGVHIETAKDEGSGTPSYDVYILLAKTENPAQVHLFQAVFPEDMGEEKIAEEMDAMLKSMQIIGTDSLELG